MANVSTEHVKHFKSKFGHGPNCYLRAGPRPLKLPAMQSSDSGQSSDDSGAGDDPHQFSAVPYSLLQLQDDYASGSDEFVPVTPEKSVEEEDGQSDGSEFHTPAQPSKRRRLPSVSPVQQKQVAVPDSDSAGIDRDSLFDSSQTASAVSSARGSLGRLSRNGHLMNTIGRLHTKKSRQLCSSL